MGCDGKTTDGLGFGSGKAGFEAQLSNLQAMRALGS